MPFYSDESTHRLITDRATEVSADLIRTQEAGELIMNIDPTDPATGEGGISVSLKELQDTKVKQALSVAGSDPHSAWAAVARAHIEEPTVSVPAAVSPVDTTPQKRGPTLEQAAAVGVIPASTQFSMGPEASQHSQAVATHSEDIAALSENVATMLASQQQLLQFLMSQQRPTPTSPPEPSPVREPVVAKEVESESVAPPVTLSLAKFSREPDKPRVPVVFDLGPGGVHRVYFHHVSRMGSSIMLYYDDRYDGHRFIPPVTPQGSTISVSFPDDRESTQSHDVVVLPLSNTFFHMDIVQLLAVTKADESAPEPQGEGMYVQDMP